MGTPRVAKTPEDGDNDGKGTQDSFTRPDVDKKYTNWDEDSDFITLLLGDDCEPRILAFLCNTFPN